MASDESSNSLDASSMETKLREEPTRIDENLEALGDFLSKKLGLTDKSDSEVPPKVLNDLSLDGVADFIKSGKCANIIVMAGAGVSTSAGIPDFRTPGSGLYYNLQKYKLPHAQAIFELDFFRKNPEPFFELARELYPGSFTPTLSHYFIRLLNDKCLLLRHYTQNIDTLDRIAGVDDDVLVESHGSFNKGHCLKCREEFTQQWMKDEIFANRIPKCTTCGGVVKPDIVFFGENLPKKFFKSIKSDFAKCDLLLVMGTSLVVQPFASLIERVPSTCPRVLINKEKAGARDSVMCLIGAGPGFDFDSDRNTRDVCWLGDCDQGCLLLAEKLGWKDELNELMEREKEKLKELSPMKKDGSRNEVENSV